MFRTLRKRREKYCIGVGLPTNFPSYPQNCHSAKDNNKLGHGIAGAKRRNWRKKEDARSFCGYLCKSAAASGFIFLSLSLSPSLILQIFAHKKQPPLALAEYIFSARRRRRRRRLRTMTSMRPSFSAGQKWPRKGTF